MVGRVEGEMVRGEAYVVSGCVRVHPPTRLNIHRTTHTHTHTHTNINIYMYTNIGLLILGARRIYIYIHCCVIYAP